jgi:hypothetical protein
MQIEVAQLNIARMKGALTYLRTHGPTAHAFTFKSAFSPPGAPDAAQREAFDDECPA